MHIKPGGTNYTTWPINYQNLYTHPMYMREPQPTHSHVTTTELCTSCSLPGQGSTVCIPMGVMCSFWYESVWEALLLWTTTTGLQLYSQTCMGGLF